MEPVTTSAMIAGIVTYLGTQLSKNKSIGEFISDFSGATVDWIRPLFLKDDGTAKEIIQDMQADPNDVLNTDAVKNTIAKALRKDPEAEKYIKEMFAKISQKEEGAKIINNIINSKNVVTGNISAGGNVSVGDSGKAE